MANSDVVPYNISLTDQSAIIQFFPHRDGPTDTQWNVTYSESSFADWSYDKTFGTGVSSHRTTFVGAYVVVEWAGTAVWLYGTGEQNSYNVRVDQDNVVEGSGSVDGLLFSQTGLTYGLHTVNLTVTSGEVSVTGAIITVGMGDPGTVLQTRNISVADNSTFFTGSSYYWSVSDLYTNQTSGGYDCITTSIVNAILSFTLSEAVGFVIYGSDDWQQGLFSVSVTSDAIGATNSVTNNSIQYSPRALWTQLDLPKYLAAGLDRSATYTVDITNLGANFNLASVLVFDAVPGSSSSGSASGAIPSATHGAGPSDSSSSPSSKASVTSSTKAIIGGVVAGCVVVALLILFAALWRNRRRRRRQTIDEATAPNPFIEESPQNLPVPVGPTFSSRKLGPPYLQESAHSATSNSAVPSTSGTDDPLMGEARPTMLSYAGSDVYETVGSRVHERDAGPAIQPPVYDPAWAEGNQQPSQPSPQRPHKRPSET